MLRIKTNVMYVHDEQHGYMLADNTWDYVASEHADL